MNKSMVKIGKTEERLNVLHPSGFRPFKYGFDLVGSHSEAVFSDDVAQEFHFGLVELTLVPTSVETVFSEPSENLFHAFTMVVQVVREDENIVKVCED